jgi:2-hydroxy-3-keto-5-methylthiopentenyl-1-phosphate phosphatase
MFLSNKRREVYLQIKQEGYYFYISDSNGDLGTCKQNEEVMVITDLATYSEENHLKMVRYLHNQNWIVALHFQNIVIR